MSSTSSEATATWMRKVHAAQSLRSPEALEAAYQRAESSRVMLQNAKKCKAVRGRADRSRALAAEAMHQMAHSTSGAAQLGIQQSWQAANAASKKRSADSYAKVSSTPMAVAVMEDSDEEEEEALAEAAAYMNAGGAAQLAVYVQEAAAIPNAPGHQPTRTKVEELMEQLCVEPRDEEGCAAKFMLYDGYSEEVKDMRDTLFTFVDEVRTTDPPAAIIEDMDKKLKGIDSAEAMGVPEDAREWIVYHMMKRAERNNLNMAGILTQFEKKMEFLANYEQGECPVCLEAFQESGDHAAKTLGCCHKVCQDCWQQWTAVMGAGVFCPLCKHDTFLNTVAMHASAPMPHLAPST